MQDTTPPLVLYGRKSWKLVLHMAAIGARNTRFKRLYALACVLTLLGTTLLWAVLGAHLQQHNADQLADPYMLADRNTFRGALFPGAHTFLLKWPIFWLLGIVGITPANLTLATVAVVLAPIILVMGIVYKLDKRPLVFGTVYLGVALALLLVPAQPYAGGVLPVNMAMLTTRNLEYAIYLIVLVLFAKAHRVHRAQFIIGVMFLTLLIASDKLFLSLSIGGALLALVIYGLRRNWQLTGFASRWLAGTLFAAVGSTGVLYAISVTHLTGLVNSTSATPYGVIFTAKSLVLGSAYSLLSVFTNAGANPAYDNRILSQLPGELASRLWSLSSLAYLVTVCMLVYACAQVVRFIWPAIRSHKSERMAARELFTLSLVWSTVAAMAVFIGTDHYYAVDARYLAISLFTLTVVVTLELRKRDWQWPEDLLLLGGTLALAIVVGVPTALHIHKNQDNAYSAVVGRNSRVVETLNHHKVDILVGDYWRVLPIRLASKNTIQVMPLSGCTQPSGTLTSKEWQPDLAKHSFAYLVSFDPSLTNYPACQLVDITAKYGRPDATRVVAGTPAHPTEALLFYDQGMHPQVRTPTPSRATTVPPVSVDKLSGTSCNQPTIMNIVAHQDDDLLFLSPDLLHDIHTGHCVRTTFLTAGDSGSNKYYWINRQLGAEAAYNTMLGSSLVWDHQTLSFGKEEYVTVATPRGNSKISLIFFNLPDGNLRGQGFTASGGQSLQKLQEGKIAQIKTVDGLSTYTSEQLVHALSQLMSAYQPADVHTQADVSSSHYPDHSDHIATGHLATQATLEYGQQHFGQATAIPVTHYIGYPVHGYPENVSGPELDQKNTAFFAYGHYDGGVCHTIEQCSRTPTYGTYLARQYIQDALPF